MAFEIQKLLAQKPKIPHLNGQEKEFCRSNSTVSSILENSAD
jgi:hypothetical protein